MFSKKLLCTAGVLAATALAPVTAAQAAATDAPREINRGTQVGSEGIIAVLIGLAASPAGQPPEGHLVQGVAGGAHGCPACPHPPPYVTTTPAGIATDGIGIGYRVRSAGAPSQIEPTSLEFPNIT